MKQESKINGKLFAFTTYLNSVTLDVDGISCFLYCGCMLSKDRHDAVMQEFIDLLWGSADEQVGIE